MSADTHPEDQSPLDAELAAEDELELAYRQALEAVAAVEQEVQQRGDFQIVTDESEPEMEIPPAAEPVSDDVPDDAGGGQPGVTPRQIVEAALFVGGTSLTVHRIRMLLRDEFDADFVEETIAGLNAQYADEQRPYEITLGEDGYRLTLRGEFERLRNRAYGYGPREVKLSQDALEVLALVAYRQPVTSRDVEQAGKQNPGGVLRQLVRRELLAIERGEAKRKDVAYRTTPRFLELFGLKDLDELPRPDADLSFK